MEVLADEWRGPLTAELCGAFHLWINNLPRPQSCFCRRWCGPRSMSIASRTVGLSATSYRRLGREGVLRHGLCPVASAHDSIHAADQYRHILRTVASALVRSDRKGICSRAGRQSVAGHTAAFEPRERAGVTSHDSGVYPMAADGRANLYGAGLYKMYTVDFK